MNTGLGLLQFEDAPAGYHLFSKIEESLQQLENAHNPGTSVVDGKHIHGKRGLKIGELVELILHDLGLRSPFQIDNHTHTILVGFITNIRDPLDLLILDKDSDFFHQVCLVYRVGNLRYNKSITILLLFGAHLTPYRDYASTGSIGLLNLSSGKDDSPSGKIRSGDDLHDVRKINTGIIYQRDQRIDDLIAVVRRDTCSHPNGNSGRSVQQ